MDDVNDGTGAGQAAVADPAAAATATQTSQVPAPVDLSDDTLVRFGGQGDPVKVRDYLSGYVSKADLTRMRQQDATQAKQEREAFQRERQQAEQLLLQQAGQLAQAMSHKGQQVPDWLQELQQAQYLDGPAAAKLVNRLMSEGVGPVYQRTNQIEQAMGMLLQRIGRQEQQFQQLTQQAEAQRNEALIDQAMKLSGAPDGARKWFQNLHASHEGAPGEDYVKVFPQWAVDEWNDYVKTVREMDRQAGKQQTTLPGRGGQVASLHALPERDDLTPAEIAQLAFERTRGQGQT